MSTGGVAMSQPPQHGVTDDPEQYLARLPQWFHWCEEHHVQPRDATHADMESFAREVEEWQHLEASEVVRHLQAMLATLFESG
jgi:hypothetical protein